MTRDDGQKLHDRFRPSFDAGEKITLDFSGTRVFVTAFFNAAVGQLLSKYSKQEIESRLLTAHLPEIGRRSWQNAIAAAERWHRDPSYRAALDRVLTAQAVEV